MKEIYRVCTYKTVDCVSYVESYTHIDISKILYINQPLFEGNEPYFDIGFMLKDDFIRIYGDGGSGLWKLINKGMLRYRKEGDCYDRTAFYSHFRTNYPHIFKSYSDLQIEHFKLLRAWDEWKKGNKGTLQIDSRAIKEELIKYGV